jgi:hypothetical protein
MGPVGGQCVEVDGVRWWCGERGKGRELGVGGAGSVGQGRGERAEEERGLEGAHGGSGRGRPAPARWETRDLGRRRGSFLLLG